MRVLSLLTLGLSVTGALMAQKIDASAERGAAIYNGPRVGVSMYIWSDKYTYTAGQSLQLKWTVKTNNDLYPYTMFVYRQNNQTGAKNYFPGDSAAVTDFGGRTAAQGFQAAPLTAQTKAVLLSSVAMPNELGMHTFVVELRDYTGTRILKTSYMKVGVISGTETVSGTITSSRTFTNDKQWNIQGIVYVKSGAVLTIEPGTFVVGQPGSNPASALIITRTGTIEAHGTKSRPIVMTSAAAFGQRTRGGNGGWGGLALLGRAPINVGANVVPGNNNTAGEFYLEGLQTTDDALYGGSDATHYCGSLEYVRVEFAGSILAVANELNSFTFGGCGTKTVAHHLQAHYGLDDAFEWFGGTMNAKYLIAGLHADDYVDFQLGWTGSVQHGIFYQSAAQNGNRGIEGDNSEYLAAAEPFSNPTLFNMTFIGSGVAGPDEGAVPGLYLRRNARGSFNNMVFQRFPGSGVFFNEAATQAQAAAGNIKMNGILLWKNNLLGSNAGDTLSGNQLAGAATTPAQATLTYLQGTPAGAAQNIEVADPMMTRPFEYSDPDFSSLFGSPVFRAGWVQPPDNGFFDQSARYIGGVGDEIWWDEWTWFPIEADILP